jgi:hypothetical protein
VINGGRLRWGDILEVRHLQLSAIRDERHPSFFSIIEDVHSVSRKATGSSR